MSMVYKTTEYRRKFKKTSPGTQQQIYKENTDYRLERKCNETRHQPFNWNGCSCDSCSDTSDASEDYPLPKCKLKHQRLLKKWDEKHKGDSNVTDIGIQTPDWGERVRMFQSQSTQVDFKENLSGEVSKLQNVIPEPISASSPNVSRKEEKSVRVKSSTLRSNIKSKRKSPDRQVKRKPPFVSYGWANEKPIMGCKKSHNINAGKDEMHPESFKRWKRKEDEAQTQEQTKRITTAKSQEKRQMCPNTDAIFQTPNPQSTNWLSEYQRSYSKKCKLANTERWIKSQQKLN